MSQEDVKNWKTLAPGLQPAKIQPVSAYVKEAQEGIVRSMTGLQYISAPQLTSTLEGLSKSVQTFSQAWKNIPYPTVEATNSLFSSVDYLKRFCLMLDFRFN